MPSAVEVRDLCVSYSGTRVLWNVALRVGRGEIVALVGPNGSGKSTLMNSISRLLPLDSGEVLVEGRRTDALPAHRMMALGMAHVLERHRLFPQMTVLENLQLGCGPGAGREQVAQGLARAFALFPRLCERQGQMASSMSGGEQQMCAIARGLMSNPRVLLIDEPFIGLSPSMRQEVFGAIERVNNDGVTVLVIEQNVAEALRLSDRAYVLREGRVVLEGESRTLSQGDQVREAFLGRLAQSATRR
jgi:branched-chain amino acid transport system ATP-binding protein